MSTPTALFDRDGTTLLPTTLCRGPWDHGYLHGGAVCGAVGWALEQARADDTLVLARATVEIRAMVPLGPLRTACRRRQAGPADPGDRGDLGPRQRCSSRGRRASGWRTAPVRRRPHRTPCPPDPDRAADPGAVADFDYPRPGFNCDAIELRPLQGTTETAGPGVTWVRLRTPVVEGEPTSGLLSIMALSDVGIAVGWEPSPTGAAFINPDVTLQVNRYPARRLGVDGQPRPCRAVRRRLLRDGA